MQAFTIPVVVLAAHFVGDFLLQSDWMATNKSKRWDALALHVALYSICFAWWGVPFVALTFASHVVTDAVTSRITSRLWFFRMESGVWEQAEFAYPKHDRTILNPWMPIEGSRRHWFFVVIGFDQLIHAVTLAVTWHWLR